MTQPSAQIVDGLYDAVKGYVARSLAPMAESLLAMARRLDAVEARQPQQGERGANGADGKDGADAVVDYDRIIAEVLRKLPAPKDGRDGRDGANGKDGPSTTELLPVIAGIVSESVKAIPPAKDGRDGRDGLDGKDCDEAAVYASVMREVTKSIGAIPIPKDGKDAPPVDVVKLADEVFARVRVPVDGKDGKDAAPVDIDAVVAQVVKVLPPATNGRDGRDGAPGLPGDRGNDGANGRDGIGIDDFDIRMSDEGRTVLVSMRAGDRVIEKRLPLAGMPIYRGVVKSGQTGFKAGDAHTWGGSLWIAKRDTDLPPPGDDWQLCVKGAK